MRQARAPALPGAARWAARGTLWAASSKLIAPTLTASCAGAITIVKTAAKHCPSHLAIPFTEPCLLHVCLLRCV